MKQETRNSTRIKEKKLTGKKIQRKIQKQLETKRNSDIELARKQQKQQQQKTTNNKQAVTLQGSQTKTSKQTKNIHTNK